MEERTKNLMKVGLGALAYYLAARRTRQPIRRGPLEGGLFGSTAEQSLNGPSKLLWGFFANEGLRGLGQSDGAALSWTLLGAIGIEWFVYTHRTKIVTVPREWSHVEKNLPGGKKITMDVEWPEGVPAPPPGYFEGLSPTVDWGHHW